MRSSALGVLVGLGFSAAACGGSQLDGQLALDTGVQGDASDTHTDTGGGETVGDTGVTEVSETSEVGETVGETVTNAAWEGLSLGDLGHVDDVVVVSRSEGYAVSGPRVLRWNGTIWTAFGEPDGTRDLHGVFADKDGLVVVVGDGGLIARHGPTGWVSETSTVEADLWAVGGRGADDLVAVGAGGVVLRWGGTAWSKVFDRSTIDLGAVWVDQEASGDEGIYAVGSGGQLVSFTTGAWKAQQIAAGSVVLKDVVGLEDGTLVAVGTAHTLTVKKTTAAAWQGQSTNDTRERDVGALAVSDGTVWAFGAEGLVLRQTGNNWSLETAANGAAGITNFAMAAALTGAEAGLLAIGDTGAGVMLNGTIWSTFQTRPDMTVTDLEAAPDGRVWASGTGGFLAVRGDQGWTTTKLSTDKDLNALAFAADGTVWAVGAAGTIVKLAPGAAAMLVPSPLPLDLYGLTRMGSGFVACGRGGALLAISATGDITVRDSGAVSDLRAVAVGGDGALWIAGGFGTLLRAVGEATPVPVVSGVGGTLQDMVAVATGVLVVGDNGTVLRASSAGAELEHEDPGVFLYGVAAGVKGAFAVGSSGTILRLDTSGGGNAWVAEKAASTHATFEAAWIDATTGEALVGGNDHAAPLERRLLSLPAVPSP